MGETEGTGSTGSGGAVDVLIPAAGSGRRLGRAENKILLPLGGQPLIRRTLRVFQTHPAIARIWLVVRQGERGAVASCLPPGAARRRLMPLVTGGAERQDSVYRGLQAMAADPPAWVLVHDGARPFCSRALLERVLEALPRAEGVVPVLPLTDTVRRIGPGGSEVVDRSGLYRVQTPQGFRWSALWEAHRRAAREDRRGTDDAQLLEQAGLSLAFVAGDPDNLKVTNEEDYRRALQWRRRAPGKRPGAPS
jgi:2-C-methyl-D-erythritol 4-phosphate cytidylyltransferase